VEPVTTSSQRLRWEAIDQVRQVPDGHDMPLGDLAECGMGLVGSTLSLQQIGSAAEGLLRPADHPGRPAVRSRFLSLICCQATAKTAPEATRKLVHPVERARQDDKGSAGAPSLEPMAVESAVQTPQDVEVMRRLSAAGWGRRRIARELGCSPETVRKDLRQGGWQPYGKPCRNSVLDGQREWLR
jgi:hypothetical protein